MLKCKGTESPADIGTKPHTAEQFERLCRQVGLRRLTGELGAVREVEVNAVMERFTTPTITTGTTTSCPSLQTAILLLCTALQAHQGAAEEVMEAVLPNDSEEHSAISFAVLIITVAFVIFMAGCAVGCGVTCLYPRRPNRQQQLPAASGGDSVDKATMTEIWEIQYLAMSSVPQNNGMVFHLPEKGRVAHFNRQCRHLGGVHDVEVRLVSRSICSTCGDYEVKKKA